MHDTSTEFTRTSKLPAFVCVLIASLASAFWPLIWKGTRPHSLEKGDSKRFVGRQTCVSCHPTVPLADFEKTGHAQTLARMQNHPIKDRLNQVIVREPENASYEFVRHEGELAVQCDRYADGRPIRLDWCFGSGRHAFSFLHTEPGHLGMSEALELRWTWYSEIDGLDKTPGHPDSPPKAGIGVHGRMYDLQGTRHCFGCHTTVLPESDGQIEWSGMVLGVQCEACHGPGVDHIRSPFEKVSGFKALTDAKEQVQLCAQCHRSESDVVTISQDPEHPLLTRFQTVGFVRSPCYLRTADSNESFKCSDCHDPHAPQVDVVEKSLAQCMRCHGGELESTIHCPVEPLGDCLKCHMPSVQAGKHLTFVDHWIRARNRHVGKIEP